MEQFKHINKNKSYVRELQTEVGTSVDGVQGPGHPKEVNDK